MKNALIAVLIVVTVAGLAGGMFGHWDNLGPGRVCAQEHSATLEYGPDVRTHPTVEKALTRFGNVPASGATFAAGEMKDSRRVTIIGDHDLPVEDPETLSLLTILHQLPTRQRTVIVLHYYAGYGTAEIARGIML